MDEAVDELREAVERIKEVFQKEGGPPKLAAPIEDARHQIKQLESHDDDGDDSDREDAIRGTAHVHDLYPIDELKQRALEEAESGLDQFDVPKDEAEFRYMMVEDGILHFKIEHENIPTIQYGDVEIPDRAPDEENLIGYVIDPDCDHDAVTVCVDCNETEHNDADELGEVRDGPHYGDSVPYPECFGCGEVLRP